MTDARADGRPVARDPGGLLLVAVYTLSWGVALVALNVVVVGLVVLSVLATTGLDASALSALATRLQDDPASAVPPWTLPVTLLIQLPAMLLLVFLSHMVVDRLWYRPRLAALGRHADDWSSGSAAAVVRPHGWAGVFALRGNPGVVALFAGLVLGLTTGALPGWIATQLREAFPFLDTGSLALLDGALVDGPLPTRLLFAVLVAIGAPVVEELVFRGFVWDALRRVGPPWVAFLGSSVLFAMYHMDPVHALALLFTAFTLGWLRWTTGSLWPCIVLHAVNNGLGVITATATSLEPSVLLAFGLALVSVTTSLGLGALKLRRDGSLASDLAPGRA